MVEYNYDDCLEQCLVQVKRYRSARNMDRKAWDLWEFQDIRDELSEAMAYFGPFYADLRYKAEQAEVDRKIHYEERKQHWKEHYGSARGTASLVESKAMQDCREVYDAEMKAKREYYQARALNERIDQVLNGIASRLKLSKHDKEHNG